MINSIKNVHHQFYLQFADVPALMPEIPKQMFDYNGDAFTTFIKSGESASPDLSQQVDAKYPSISITKFGPELREGYVANEQPYYGALRDTDDDNVMDTISQFFEALPLVFRYEINVFSKDAMHHEIIQEWLMRRFMHNNQSKRYFVYNKALTVETFMGVDEIGDIVPYDFRYVDDPVRSDGVKETLYEFVTYADVHLTDPVDFPVIKELIVNSFQQTI